MIMARHDNKASYKGEPAITTRQHGCVRGREGVAAGVPLPKCMKGPATLSIEAEAKVRGREGSRPLGRKKNRQAAARPPAARRTDFDCGETGDMSPFETDMSPVETRDMPPVETGDVSRASTGDISPVETGVMSLVETGDMPPVETGDMSPVHSYVSDYQVTRHFLF